MGNHERKTEYGMCGIITAVVSLHLVCKDGILHLESNLAVNSRHVSHVV